MSSRRPARACTTSSAAAKCCWAPRPAWSWPRSLAAGTAAGYKATISRAASLASIASIFVFGAVPASAFASMQPIYPAEVMSNDMRAQGMGTYELSGGAAGFINPFVAPIASTHVRPAHLSVLVQRGHGSSRPGPPNVTGTLWGLLLLCFLGLH